MILAETNKLRI